MKKTDVCIIGAGLLGCFAARSLSQYNLEITVLEKSRDVSTGISKANTGIVYSGYDVKPGTKKSRFCLRANENFEDLCKDLGVRFVRCGSLLVSFGERGDAVIQKKYENGLQNGVPDLRILEAREAAEMEPNLSKNVRKALYAGTTGCVNPWELCIAAYECAAANKADFRFGREVKKISRNEGGFYVETEKESFQAGAVINCAGLHSDRVREMTEDPLIRLFPTGSDYLVMDTTAKDFVRHVIFHEPEIKGKGLTLVPTVDGNLLIGPTQRPMEEDEPLYPKAGIRTSQAGISELFALCEQIVPGLRTDQLIRTFASARPNPFYLREEKGAWVPGEKDISGFTVLEEKGLISMIGIKTPGMTCASELGAYAADLAVKHLGKAGRNKDYDPTRRPIVSPAALPLAQREAYVREHPDYGKLICRCRQISEGEVKEAIRRGAVTPDGVKRRTKAGSGRCQGAYCRSRVEELIKKYAHFEDGHGTI